MTALTNPVSAENTSNYPSLRERLPGIPVIISGREFKAFSIDDLIRDDTGKIITATKHSGAAELMSNYFGRNIEEVVMIARGEKSYNLPHERTIDTVAFCCADGRRLSFTEHRAASALVWVAESYYKPVKRRDKIIFPTILNDLPKELQAPRFKAQMWKIFTEAKAIQTADVLESMFPDTKTLVFQDGDGWFLAVASNTREFDDSETIAMIDVVLWVLSDFDIVPNYKAMLTIDESDGTSQEYLDEKAVQAFNAYSAQQRIEEGVNAILARLNQTPSTATKTPPMAKAATPTQHVDSRRNNKSAKSKK